jgi:hypothetical protein
MSITPQVLACGQRSVFIPKSTLAFPAWLVLLPETTTTKTTPGDAAATTGRQPPAFAARWRSRRDWTRLGRAAARHCSENSGPTAGRETTVGLEWSGVGSSHVAVVVGDDLLPSLPKAAMDRLVRNVPWIRPNLQEQVMFDADERAAVARHELPESLIQDGENRWDVQWTKSLRRMDDFLQRIYRHSILQNQQQRNRTDRGNVVRPDPVAAAWEEFCRPVDTDNLLRGRDEVGLKEKDDAPASLAGGAAAARGNALGQYFCSPDSAARLVDLFLRESRRRVHRALASGPVHITIMEPSCGDGRLLRQLVDAMEREPLLPPGAGSRSTVRIVGMDVDDGVLEIGRRHLQRGVNDSPAVEFVAGDFLLSRRGTVGIMKNTSVNVQEQASCTANRLILMLGGPPYSAGAGSASLSLTASSDTTGVRSSDSTATAENRGLHSSDAMRRDLPLRFVRHAIEEHGAEAICFLVPERCRDCSDLRELLDRHDYGCTTLECDSLFYFQGSVDHRVKQPSVFQSYQRN